MEITRPFNNDIIIIHNFFNEEDNNVTLKELANSPDEPWIRGNNFAPTCYYAKAAPSNFFNDPVSDNVTEINRLAIDISDKLLNDDLEYTQFGIITRNFKDGYFLHWDQENDSSIKYGIVYYFNDNYDGGEIFYPKLNIQYKPKARDLIIHPGTLEYMHGVRDVSNGVRYSMNMFAKTI